MDQDLLLGNYKPVAYSGRIKPIVNRFYSGGHMKQVEKQDDNAARVRTKGRY